MPAAARRAELKRTGRGILFTGACRVCNCHVEDLLVYVSIDKRGAAYTRYMVRMRHGEAAGKDIDGHNSRGDFRVRATTCTDEGTEEK